MSSNNAYKLTKKDLNKVFFNSLSTEFNWNGIGQMNAGFLMGMLPALEKIYPDKNDLAEAMTRHLELFNITPAIESFVLGISIAMEEKRAEDPDNFDTSSINKVKSALMGPLSGIGDAIYLGTLRTIAIGAGMSLSLQGSILGPIIFWLVYNIPHYIIRYKALFYGRELGENAITTLMAKGKLNNLIAGASIVGLMCVGAMISEMIYVEVPVMLGEQSLGEILDGIIPGIVPLLICGLSAFLLKKKVPTLLLMYIYMILGIILAYFGIIVA